MNDLQKLCIEISTRLLKVASGNRQSSYDVDYYTATGKVKITHVSFPTGICYYEVYDDISDEYIIKSIDWEILSETDKLAITLEIYERYFKNI